MNYKSETKECKLNYPGGKCDHPDGRGNCTYSIEEAGEIDIDELVGIKPKFKSREDFCRAGGFEGNGAKVQNGRFVSFWNTIFDKRKNQWRYNQTAAMFNAKYPNMPRVEDLSPPPCDFTTKGYW